MIKILLVLVTFLYANLLQAQLAKTSTEQYKASFEKSIDILKIDSIIASRASVDY